jgi:hypothetical protein
MPLVARSVLTAPLGLELVPAFPVLLVWAIAAVPRLRAKIDAAVMIRRFIGFLRQTKFLGGWDRSADDLSRTGPVPENQPVVLTVPNEPDGSARRPNRFVRVLPLPWLLNSSGRRKPSVVLNTISAV